jgi:tetratricopeptide (TPR) repeat protein
MARRRKRSIEAGSGSDSAELARRREETMRPWPTLGYDWDTLGMHLVSREAFRQAEAMLRRAVWLNPYEPRFKVHLAWCLCRENRYAEARTWIEQVPADCLAEAVADIKRLIEEGEDDSKRT